ncbi:unnamed protein product [Protopolystoma xenopodis]|uniref:Uncharacterized protein n=1 Tax=Protopolystoma xenopodis TaxID=117903 RepID=A0A3S5CJ91_9PLAT|nr:unnamed protein product [Protopolystoma xenopodis]
MDLRPQTTVTWATILQVRTGNPSGNWRKRYEEKLGFDESAEITLLEGPSFRMQVHEEEIRWSISPDEDG